ncbi:LOW QUALITY PROTEIN: hypothetical protein TorRG33x02_063520 [Trema orientale]|uniref:Uncharacterized protein n=1 Tax=Trema orientale TaxID=63057 RepID=A0A2P5FJ03_TREOI|nr:LOW QUALITY PROTEIN: hypothetical protein TorRG33x02_063520 [Trema orientale]
MVGKRNESSHVISPILFSFAFNWIIPRHLQSTMCPKRVDLDYGEFNLTGIFLIDDMFPNTHPFSRKVILLFLPPIRALEKNPISDFASTRRNMLIYTRSPYFPSLSLTFSAPNRALSSVSSWNSFGDLVKWSSMARF